ncbi:PqqD family protein [Nostoc cycadae]|uniref:PqqD family protein n=1 Tax=Nostoc cycadae TaxID=246795 RepID=UPI000CCC48F0|nr:PqqD family protein [Nostoc cycadae]
MIPVARTENLLIQEVGEELIVYDETRDTAHCLSAIAVRVWYLCNGQNTVETIARLLQEEFEFPPNQKVDWHGLVQLTLAELEQFHLLDAAVTEPLNSPQTSRRQVLKKVSLVGGFAIGSLFPAIKSIIVPTPAMAAPTGSSSTSSPTTTSTSTTTTAPTTTSTSTTTTAPTTTPFTTIFTTPFTTIFITPPPS